jgi:hypothetical protein
MTQQNKTSPVPFTYDYAVIIPDTKSYIDDLLKEKTLPEVARDLKVDPSTLMRWYDNTMTKLDTRNTFTTQLRVAIKVLKNTAQGTGAPSLAQPVAGAPAPRAAGGPAPRAAGGPAPRAGRGLAPRAAGGSAPVASSKHVFEDTRKWVTAMRGHMGNDVALVAKTLQIDKKTLIRWAAEKMTAHEQEWCTFYLRRKIKIVEDDRTLQGLPSMKMPFKGVAAAAGGPVAAAGGAAAAEPDHGTLVKAWNTLLVARVVELEKHNEELRVLNKGWLEITSDLTLLNTALQNTACPASASNE